MEKGIDRIKIRQGLYRKWRLRHPVSRIDNMQSPTSTRNKIKVIRIKKITRLRRSAAIGLNNHIRGQYSFLLQIIQIAAGQIRQRSPLAVPENNKFSHPLSISPLDPVYHRRRQTPK